MFTWLSDGFKNRYLKMILAALSLGIAAVWFGLSFRVALSVVFIAGWFGYVFLIVKKSEILSDWEKNITRVILIILVGLIFSTIRESKEIFNLILPMMIRSDIALLLWFKADKGLWITALAFAAINTVGLITLYLTVDLFKSSGQKQALKLLTVALVFFKSRTAFLGRYAGLFLAEPTIKNIIKELQEIIWFIRDCRGIVQKGFMAFKNFLTRWLAKQALILIFLIYVVPLPIPYVPSLIITIVRCKNVRYGLWSLVLASFLRGLIFAWLVWQGLARL